MYRCVICHFSWTLDDVALKFKTSDHCVCLRCYTRETRTEKPLAAALSREAARTVEEAP